MKWGPALLVVVVLLLLGGIVVWLRGSKSNEATRQNVSSYPSTTNMAKLSLTSSAFEENGSIPEKYTCEGSNVNPPLLITNVPADAKSLALIVEDPDIPDSVKESMHIQKFDHWVVFNIPRGTTEIAEHTTPPGVEGNNGAGKKGYTGPCPPDREHRYFFKLYALDRMLDLKEGASADDVTKAIENDAMVIEETELMGLYNKKANR